MKVAAAGNLPSGRGVYRGMSVSCAALAAAAILLPVVAFAQSSPTLTATEIMERVAANTDRAEAERTRYTYVQHARVASRKGKTVQCEEITDTRVTPEANGSHRELLKLDGLLLRKKTYVTYSALPEPHHEHADNKMEDDDTDRDLVENLRKNLTDDKSKDGLNAGLFPLTTKAQADYLFTLKGRERRNGHDTFHIAFAPRDKEDFGWRGDAWIDAGDFKPVFVQTAMGRNIPFAVRALLGTSVPGLGFSATYAPQAGGVWFPTSFGSEFKINVLFFFHRTITMQIENRDFERTHTSARIVDEPAAISDAP